MHGKQRRLYRGRGNGPETNAICTRILALRKPPVIASRLAIYRCWKAAVLTCCPCTVR